MTTSPSNPLLYLHIAKHRHAMQTVLEHIDLQVTPDEAVALVGPSGCGKTTLLKLAAGLQQPWEGTVHNGFARVGVMFQQPRLLPWLNTRDNIALGLKARGESRRYREHIAEQLAADMGLKSEDLDKHPSELSGGMQSRAALARAFAIQPDLLLLDEAFSALDIGLKAELYQLLMRLRNRHGTAVLMVTHDVMEALRLADRIVVLAGQPGGILTEIPLPLPATERTNAWVYQQTAEFLARPDIRSAFSLPESNQ